MSKADEAVPIPFYSLSSAVSSADYDTGLKLFDTPKTFTILCEAHANVYSWGNTHAMFGLGTGLTFRVGRTGNVIKMVANAAEGSATNYNCGFACNYSGDSRTNKARSVYAKGSNEKSLRRIAVTYNATTRKVNVFSAGYSNMSAPNDAWWTLSGDISSETTIKLNISTGYSCTVNHFNVYGKILSDAQINDFLANGVA